MFSTYKMTSKYICSVPVSRLVLTILLCASLSTVATAKLGLCESDCDRDSDCANGLWCADAHKEELEAKGLDSRKANCQVRSAWNFEVCFDPAVLKTEISGGAGGDPHFRTYDGTKYSYHGQCDLIIARSPSFGGGVGLDVHARTSIVPAGTWSLISNAAVRIGEDVFEVSNDGRHFLNGVPDLEFPLKLMGSDLYTITQSIDKVEGTDARTGEKTLDDETFYFISLNSYGGKIRISNFRSMIAVRVESFLPDTSGMLGVHGVVGMVGRDGKTVLTDPEAMGQEWQVTDQDGFLFQDKTYSPLYPQRCLLPSSASMRRRLRHSEKEISKAQKACEFVSEDMKEFCVQDVLQTGDVTMAHGYGNGF